MNIYNDRVSGFNIEKSRREILIKRAITEVNLNTPDSVELAVATLKSGNVDIPQTLIDLKKLHSQFMKRSSSFADQSHDLQAKALEDLGKLLN